MNTIPSDTEILGVLTRQRGMTMPTYYIKNCLRMWHPGLQTSQVLRRLKALEKAGLVKRVTSIYANMLCWDLASQEAASAKNGEKGAEHG